MIESLQLCFGPEPGGDALSFAPKTMTVFVGPNNSGKSLAIKELEARLTRQVKPTPRVIRDVRIPQLPTITEGDTGRIRRRVIIPQLGYNEQHIASNMGIKTHVDGQVAALLSRATRSDPAAAWVATALVTLSLSGSERLKLTEPQKFGDLLGDAENHLSALIKSPNRRRVVRRIVHEAVNRYLVLDPTEGGLIRLRLSEVEPEDDRLELSLTPEAFAFHRRAEPIADASDGIKAFVGIAAAALSDDYRILLVDEPEAFLHPPLARLLGHRLTERAQASDGHVFAATHSADFLMGCLSARQPLNIVRLTYERKKATARLLAAADLTRVMRSPLLRSAGVLSGLFYRHVVVTEADGDASCTKRSISDCWTPRRAESPTPCS